MANQITPGAGNARALSQISECEDLFLTYTSRTAAEIIANACHRGGFTQVRPEGVVQGVGLFRALRSPSVDVRALREELEGKAKAACDELLDAIEDDRLLGYAIFKDDEND
jgi:hypothetical protein